MTWERSFQCSRHIHIKLLTLLEEIKDSSWGGLRRSLYSSLQYGYTHTHHRHRLQLFVHPWHSFISLSVFNTMKSKNLHAGHLKMPVLILVKDSHSSLVKTLYPISALLCAWITIWSLRSLLATPRGDENKTVTIATVCGTSRICKTALIAIILVADLTHLWLALNCFQLFDGATPRGNSLLAVHTSAGTNDWKMPRPSLKLRFCPIGPLN